MKKLYYILILIIILSSCKNRTKNIERVKISTEKEFLTNTSKTDYDSLNDTIESNPNNTAFCVFFPEELPQFGNGWEDLKNYLENVIRYPESAIKDSVKGRVFINFRISRNGAVLDAKILRGIRSDLDYECIQVIDNMPDWKPGKQRGKPVEVSFNIPIRFSFKPDSTYKGIIITPRTTKADIEYKLYPNPANNYINIEVFNWNFKVGFQIFSMNGQIIKSGELNSNIEKINLNNLKPGPYIIHLLSKKYNIIKVDKIVKK